MGKARSGLKVGVLKTGGSRNLKWMISRKTRHRTKPIDRILRN